MDTGIFGEWHYRVRPARNSVLGFVAWCAKTPKLGEGPLDVNPAHDVHFEFGHTAEDAVGKLRKSLAN